ncbi:MAG: hypothetical protein JWM76_4968 [Pseudonocardiales bacterium]|nr:hypothetical protein [Pseudonocardiales bacterium]
MMSNSSSVELLTDGFGRVEQLVRTVVDGLSDEQLAHRVEGRANSIGWLVWHLLRIQDDHVADAANREQVWLTDGWHERFALPFDPGATGYGHSADDVGAVRVSAGLLLGYNAATSARTLEYLSILTESELARIVDASWDPPVTVAVRLVSVLSDDLQHVGQAAFVKGLAP